MKAVIIHDTLGRARGGSERVSVSLIRLLAKLGYEVTVKSTDSIDKKSLEHFFGLKIPPFKQEPLPSSKIKLPFFGIYQNLYNFYRTTRSSKWKYDLAISPRGDNFPFVPVEYDLGISYIPAPLFLPKTRKYERFPWNLYFKPYSVLFKRKLASFLEEVKRGRIRVITYSKYGANLIANLLKIKPFAIIPPPVNVERFHVGEKESICLSVGRFDPSKNYESILKLAKEFRDIRFIIAGQLYRENYYFRLLKTKPDNVELVTNPSFTQLVELYAKSKWYVHTYKGEPFGITVIEACASGCIPLMPYECGAGEGLPDKHRYNHDLIDKFSKLLNEDDTGFFLSYAGIFTEENFFKSFIKVIGDRS